MVPDPLAGLSDQTTFVSLLLPLTVAVNCWVPLKFSFGAAGLTADIDSVDPIVTVVLTDLLGSAWLAAVTVTLLLAGRSFGAV